MRPSISIVIPCYNHGAFIQEAIRSVEQFPDRSVYELIIINDGSTDGQTREVLKGLQQSGYRVIDQENQGLARARNHGIELSQTEVILPLDADNRLRPRYISLGLEVLARRPEVGIVYGDAWRFGEEDRLWQTGPFDLRRLLAMNYIDACVVMRKEVWRQVGGYDPAVSAIADWDINLSAYEKGWKFHYLQEVLFDYRVGKSSMIHTYNREKEQVEYIARKHGPLYREEFLRQIGIRKQVAFLTADIRTRLLRPFRRSA